MSIDELRRELLQAFEPDYASLARRGKSLLPILEQLAGEADAGGLSRIVSLVGLIEGDEAAGLLSKLASNEEPIVRVAAAAVCARRNDAATRVTLRALLDDDDLGVRHRALLAVEKRRDAELADAVAARATGAVDDPLHELSNRVLKGLRTGR